MERNSPRSEPTGTADRKHDLNPQPIYFRQEKRGGGGKEAAFSSKSEHLPTRLHGEHNVQDQILNHQRI
jgi:hypothetical protein